MRFYLSLYLFIAGFYLLTASGRIGLSDSVAMFNVAQSVINERSFSSEPCEYDVDQPVLGASIGCVSGTGGRHYAGYGLVPSLVVVPAILCARSISELVHVNALVASKVGVSIFTVLVAPLVCLILAGWILKLGYNHFTAAAGASILAFASSFWNNSVMGFLSEPYFTLAVLTSVSLLSNPRRRFACALAGLAFGIACGTRLNGIILLPAFILSMVFYIRAHKLSMADFLGDFVQFFGPFSVCMLLMAVANYERFGSPFKTGYHLALPTISIALSVPFFQGLSELLFSGEIGLLVFVPWVLIALICFPWFARAHLCESLLCGTSFMIFLLFFAKFSESNGGWVAGPRYLIPMLPFLVLTMAPAIQYLQQSAVSNRRSWAVVRWLMIALVGAGFLIQSVGVIYPVGRYYSLVEFYKSKPVKPWWSGSIPLASVDFLSKMNVTVIKEQATQAGEFDTLVARHKAKRAFASADSAATEDQYLRRFPNPANMMLPNLMVFKLGLLGIPASLIMAYLVGVIAMVIAGAVGLGPVLTTVPQNPR
jgi:hypothetical protein